MASHGTSSQGTSSHGASGQGGASPGDTGLVFAGHVKTWLVESSQGN